MADEKAEERIRRRLQKNAQALLDAITNYKSAVSNPRTSIPDIETYFGKQKRLLAEQSRLVADLRLTYLESENLFGAYRTPAGQRPFREQVLDVLNTFGVPATPRTISEFAAAALNLSLPAARFSSLRRDEESAFKKNPAARPAWVAPAINAGTLTPIPRVVADSSWSIERRLIGPRTLRVNHLYILLAFIESTQELSGEDELAESHMYNLTLRYASTVRGALRSGSPQPKLGEVKGTVMAELEQIEGDDRREREAAAERIRSLPTYNQIWGLKELEAVGTSA